MKRTLACVLLGLSGANAFAAEPCMDNFKSEGNFLTGRTYKTWALVSGVRQVDAFQRVHAYTVANGFTVLSADKEAGVLSAAQSVSYGQGKTVPLGIIIQPEGDAVRISVNYATSGGMLSPEDAIKRHFCATVAAAGSAQGVPMPAAAAAGAMPAPAGGVAARPTMPGFAAITQGQQQALRQELAKTVPNEKVRALVKEAAPTIAAFIEQLSCLSEVRGASAMNAYAGPGIDLGSRYIMLRPMRSAQYHDKSSCMTVTRVHGWTAPANNALRFEVVYTAADSGEVAKGSYEMMRQPDGAWLVLQ